MGTDSQNLFQSTAITILINLVYTLVVWLLPFVIYRIKKKRAIEPKKSRRVVIFYMITYSVLRIIIGLILASSGVAIDGKTLVPNILAMVLWGSIDVKILSKGYDTQLAEDLHRFEVSVLSGDFSVVKTSKKVKSVKKRYPSFRYLKKFVRFIGRITESVTTVYVDKEAAVIPHDFFDPKPNEYYYRILVFAIFLHHCNTTSLKVNVKAYAKRVSKLLSHLLDWLSHDDSVKLIRNDISSALNIAPFTPENIGNYYVSKISYPQIDEALRGELVASFNSFFEMLKQGSSNYPDEPELMRVLLVKSKYYNEFTAAVPELNPPT